MEANHRYRLHELNMLVGQLNSQDTIYRRVTKTKINQDRKVHRSCMQIPRNSIEERKPFKKDGRNGEMFQKQALLVPYLFIPKYKNQTFIMPDRVFEKGDAGKRFHVQMKDSTITSFRDFQSQKVHTLLHRKSKDETISGRKMQQLNRILDQQDGRVKARNLKQYLKSRKIFNPTKSSSDVFSMSQPMLEPRDQEFISAQKLSLAKTLGPNTWRHSSRGSSRKTVNMSGTGMSNLSGNNSSMYPFSNRS